MVQVTVRCAYCGKEIGEMIRVPSENHLGCPYCRGVTNAIVGHDGSTRMAPYAPPPPQPHPASPPPTTQQARFDLVYRHVHTEGGIPSAPEYDILSRSWRIPPPTTKTAVYYLAFAKDDKVEHGIEFAIVDRDRTGSQILKRGTFATRGEQLTLIWSDGSYDTATLTGDGSSILFGGEEYQLR